MTTLAPATAYNRDPFNWPSLNRKDLMSATGGLGNGSSDLFEMTKSNLRPKKRLESANLRADDIHGKYNSFAPLISKFLHRCETARMGEKRIESTGV